MQTPILALAGPTTGPSNAASRFISLAAGYGSTGWQTASGSARTPMARAGSYSNLYVRIPNALTAGQSYAITLLVNGVASALTCTVTDAGLTASDTTNTAAVSLGDDVAIQITPSGTPTAQDEIQIGLAFDATDSGKGLLFCGHGSSAVAGFLQLGAWIGGGTSATEAPVRAPAPTSGVINRIYARRNTAPGAGTSVTYTLRVNGVDTDVSCTISEAGMTANGAGSATIAAGDVLTIGVTVSGSPASSAGAITLDWDPDTDGEAMMFDVWSAAPSTTEDRYGNARGRQNAGIALASEADAYNIAPVAFTAQKLRVLLDTAPGAGRSRTFTLRKNAADTALVAAVADANTTGSDPTNTASVAVGDLLTIETSPSGTPAVTATAHVGWVALTGAAPPAGSAGGLLLLGVG